MFSLNLASKSKGSDERPVVEALNKIDLLDEDARRAVTGAAAARASCKWRCRP